MLSFPLRLSRTPGRARLLWSSAVADVISVVGACAAAVALRNAAMAAFGVPAVPVALDWSAAVLAAAAVLTFYASGLYEMEVYVSRPLHVWTLLRATLIAFAVTAVAVYAIKSAAFDEPRLVLFMTLVIFLLFAGVLRLGVLDGLYVAWVRQQRPVSVVLGDSPDAEVLAERLGGLRGFERVQQATPSALRLGMAEALTAMFDGRPSADRGPLAVFIDAHSARPREVFGAVTAAQAHGADVYVLSRLLRPLEGNQLLGTLFDAPVVRVRGTFGSVKPYPLKRAFDVVGSLLLLLLCSPVLVVLGLIIRLTSPGPVFFTQTRVGSGGTPFEFLKLRSMVLNEDASIHSDYVRAFIHGAAPAVAMEAGGEAVFKRVDDPRITPVGKVIRKYSLDELPQFWNVLRGDMSLVGPRPPLPYEVSEYDDWCSLRLTVPSGVTGLWQVVGRSRVSFDEMILQDLMYAQNMRLFLDVRLCLKTVPAALLGSGGG